MCSAGYHQSIVRVEVEVVTEPGQEHRTDPQVLEQVEVTRWLDVVLVVAVGHGQAEPVEHLSGERRVEGRCDVAQEHADVVPHDAQDHEEVLRERQETDRPGIPGLLAQRVNDLVEVVRGWVASGRRTTDRPP